MSISFYDASVQNYLQTVGAMRGVLDKGLAYCKSWTSTPKISSSGASSPI